MPDSLKHRSGAPSRPAGRSSASRRRTSAAAPFAPTIRASRRRTKAGHTASARTATSVSVGARKVLAPIAGLTGRSLVLLAITLLALVALVPTVNGYVMQQQRLSTLRAQVAEQEREVKGLEAQVARWEDPTFVSAQARERLLFAYPGETQYRLTDSSGAEVPQTTQAAQEEQRAKTAWFGTMWDSLVAASQAAPPEDPADKQGP